MPGRLLGLRLVGVGVRSAAEELRLDVDELRSLTAIADAQSNTARVVEVLDWLSRAVKSRRRGQRDAVNRSSAELWSSGGYDSDIARARREIAEAIED